MKIVVIGPGAMGCLFAALLAESGSEVLLLDHRADRAECLNREGIRIEGVSGEHHVRVPVSVLPADTVGADLFLVCVKSYNTRAAVEAVKPHLKDEARVLTLQNGVGNIEILGQAIGLDRVWGGVTSQGATVLSPGRVRHAGTGPTVIGPAGNANQAEALAAVAGIFTRAGFPAQVETRVEPLIWSKLIVNVGINPLTAITRLKNGRLLEYPGTRMIMEQAVNEAVAVARAQGIELIYSDPIARVRTVARATADNVASMLQDVLAHRQTEIDSINGAVIEYGRKSGVDTPINEVLTALVKTIESSYEEAV